MNKKIAFFGISPWEKERLIVQLKKVDLDKETIFYDYFLSRDNLPAERDYEIIGVFVDSQVSKEVIEHFPQLKLIVTLSTGYDHIDIKAAQDKGVTVANVPSYGENTVAEYTMGLILMLSRKLYQAYHQVRESGSFKVEGLRGFDLKGKTLGVIGTGRIGCHVIKMAKGFDMEVIAHDVYPKEILCVEIGFKYVPFEEVLQKSDIVTLHVPYLPSTHHLLNKETFKIMKKESYLINTSRGGVVDTEALVEALSSGHLAGAALDVLEEEGIIKDELTFLVKGHPQEHNLRTILANHVLIDMPNVIVSPHNAFNSWEAIGRIVDTTVDNISSFIKGEKKNLVQIRQ